MRRVSALLAVLAFVAIALGGCLTPSGQSPHRDLTVASFTAGLPFPPASAFAVNGPDGKPLPWSLTVEKGPYEALPAQVLKVPSFDGAKLAIGLFLPDVPNGTRVPVLMDVGPYYGELDDDVGTPAHVRLGKFLIDNFVPHGYAVVQASVRGTGQSEGCNDYMGDVEQKDLSTLVTFLGKAPWSNGNVGIIGKSYDGSTPWEAAASGNPYLKTIVPIEGIDDLQQLHYRNGSSESRSLILGEDYYTYGFLQGGPGGAPRAPTNPGAQCATSGAAVPEGAYGYATGGGKVLPGPLSDYWATRDFRARALASYKGSLFYVHGFQDWNVKPSQGLDVYDQFPGRKMALVGEWAHDYADRADEHPDVRMDWAEMLLRWFDQELKGANVDTGPAMQLEDTHGHWTVEKDNAFPPTDAAWLVLHPSAGGKLVASGASGSATLAGGAATAASARTPLGAATDGLALLTFTSDPFPNGTIIEGLPQLHVTVTPHAPGGALWAELHEVLANGSDLWIGRAQMDLDYAGGGEAFQPIVPGMPVAAKMEFYPMDARLLPGSKLKLVLTQEGAGSTPLPRPEDAAPLDVQYGDQATSLSLPLVQRDLAPSPWDVPTLNVDSKTGGGASWRSGDT
jgi:predicted acyl esterase